MFVLVTVLGVFFGWIDWQRRMVKERWASFYSMRSDGQAVVNWNIIDEDQPVPFPRNLMSDLMFKSIQIRHGTEEGAIDRIRAAFPESKVYMEEPLPWLARPATP